MRQKRSKSYRKLLSSYILHFGFRPPFQVVIDASFAQTLSALHLTPQEALARLSDVLQVSQLSKGKVNKQQNSNAHQHQRYGAGARGGGGGGEAGVSGNDEIKLMITQCSMVELYRDEKLGDLQKDAVQLAKNWERRKCNHREAIPSDECLAEVIGPANRHRYIVASDSNGLRRDLREKVAGVPVVHSNSSRVIVLEKMSEGTSRRIQEIEAAKYAGPSPSSSAPPAASNIVSAAPGDPSSSTDPSASKPAGSGIIRGGNRPKAPNPLSNKKPKKVLEEEKREKLKRTREIQERTEANRLKKKRKMEEGEEEERRPVASSPPPPQQQQRDEKQREGAMPSNGEGKAYGAKEKASPVATSQKSKGVQNERQAAKGEEDGPAKKKRKRGGRGGASKTAAAATTEQAVAAST